MKSNFFKLVYMVSLATALSACGNSSTNDEMPANGVNSPDTPDDVNAKVIYGDDNRLDLFQIQDRKMLELADSTAALIFASDLLLEGNRYKVTTTPFANSFRLPLCQGEPFREQDTAPFCSGFLVAPNIMLTAGHCVQTQGTPSSDCSTARFVFGFSIKAAGTRPLSIPSSEVYSCKRIIKQTLVGDGADFSIVELDRPVTGHRPLVIRRTGQPAVSDPLVVIGHPSGLPTKVADGARVRNVFTSYIQANLDTYGGNSGSAVFNAVTKEVEGILVRGEEDFVSQGNCMISKRCANDACRGEDVTRISVVLPFLPELQENPTPPELPLPGSRYEYKKSAPIPDNSVDGITTEVFVPETPKGRKIKVEINITHPWRGDLIVSLISPTGEEIILVNRKGRSADHIVGIYGGDLMSEGNLQSMSKVTQTGRWKLKVSDRAARDTGTLNSWALAFETETLP